MKKLTVLGPGCPRCDALARLTREAADRLGIDYELEKVTDVAEFSRHGVMLTPGLVVDGELKVQGRVPTPDEIEQLIADVTTT